MPAAPMRGVLGHDDFLAGDRRQHGVTLDRARQIGHGPHAAELVAREEARQVVGRAEIAAPPAILLALRHVELEDQHQAGVVAFLAFSIARPNHAAGLLDGLARDRQMNVNEPADLLAGFRLVVGECLGGKRADSAARNKCRSSPATLPLASSDMP